MEKNTFKLFRGIALAEGISYLILLFIAMPLKYQFGEPIYVRIFGMIHGVLFVIFSFLLLKVKIVMNFNISFSMKIFISSLIPFGAWWMDNQLKKVSQS